ncbi:MAG: VOC family protein [Flavobacterium sp.]|nr:MAG: VOC family protein [Flavobacterium sp.]
MNSIIPYIAFPGTCKEAMEFYADTLNGRITVMQSFAEAPMEVPEQIQDRIFNSELKAGSITIKASDDLPTHPVTQGSNMSLYVVFPNAELKTEVFNKLSDGGQVLFPISDNFGMLKDKFGIQWMVVHHDD